MASPFRPSIPRSRGQGEREAQLATRSCLPSVPGNGTNQSRDSLAEHHSEPHSAWSSAPTPGRQPRAAPRTSTKHIATPTEATYEPVTAIAAAPGPVMRKRAKPPKMTRVFQARIRMTRATLGRLPLARDEGRRKQPTQLYPSKIAPTSQAKPGSTSRPSSGSSSVSLTAGSSARYTSTVRVSGCTTQTRRVPNRSHI